MKQETNDPHPLANPLSQKYADAILKELPKMQSALHRPNTEKMCALLQIEAETNAKQATFSALDVYLRGAITETDLMKNEIDKAFPVADTFEDSILYRMDIRPEFHRLPISDDAIFILEAAFRYLESLPKESAAVLESGGWPLFMRTGSRLQMCGRLFILKKVEIYFGSVVLVALHL